MNADDMPTLRKPSRVRVLLKVGSVFASGLLLAILQFSPTSVVDLLDWWTEPFTSWRLFSNDGFVVFWFSTAALMLIVAGISILSKRLVWLAYLTIAVHWLFTYGRLAISF